MATIRQRIRAREAKRQAVRNARIAARGVAVLAALLTSAELDTIRPALRFTANHTEDASTPPILLEFKRLESSSTLGDRITKRLEQHLDVHQRPLPEVRAILRTLLDNTNEETYEEERVKRLAARLPPDTEDE